MRSRVVGVDTQQVTAARLGRETLRLNLFDDAAVSVQIDRVRPTRSGYFITGRPQGFEWGEVRLVVNGPVMVGTVVTPEGKYTIRFGGSGRHVIRQVDPSAELLDDDVVENPTLSGARGVIAPGDPLLSTPPQEIASGNPLGAVVQPATAAVRDQPTEDGSEVRVLVVYTPAMQARNGGLPGVEGLIDLLINSTNQAFETSGINPRLVLAHSASVNYVEEHTHTDLGRLAGIDDGYMDEVHALRNEHAADLVHLLRDRSDGPLGTAIPMHNESLTAENSAAFAVTTGGHEETFTHEIGHNFGLYHDRFTQGSSSTIYPFAFGYSNNRAFETGAPAAARWRTIMAVANRCGTAGFSCPRLFRFSNPDQTHEGDPLGVPADDPATGPEGPADARLTINRSAPWVGSFRSEACTEFSVSPETPVAPLDGGEVVVKVETAPGCLWEASTRSDFIDLVSDARVAGTGFVTIDVEANPTDGERIGTISVADKSIDIRQLATDAGICGRTPSVARAIAGNLSCDEVDDQHLRRITRLDLIREGVTSLKAGDFDGLSSLQWLLLENNQLTELPEDVFSGLSNLEVLNLAYNRFAELPEGLFTGLSSLEVVYLNNNQLAELPAHLFAGLSNLQVLLLRYNELTHVSQEQFAGLENLERLDFYWNKLSALPDEVFSDLRRLNDLSLDYNQLAEWPGRPFASLAELETLEVFANRLSELPADAFAGLPSLKVLNLGDNFLTTLPAGLFSGLGELEELSLWDNQLTGLPADIFSGLSNLTSLNLHANDIAEFPPGLFSGLSRLRSLWAGRNEMTTLPAGIFSGLTSLQKLDLFGSQISSLPPGIFSPLSALTELNLYRNQLSSLPDGVFSGLASLEVLYLRGNPVDPLPLDLTLEKTGDDQFKAVARTGAPFALAISIAGNGGAIEGDAETVTVPQGAVESALLRIVRGADSQQRVTVDMGMLPELPDTHSGYVLVKDEALPLLMLPSIDPADATLSELRLSEEVLDPAFAPDTSTYKASFAHAVTSATVSLATSNGSATAAFRDASDAALPDADANADGHQLNLSEGENVIKVLVTAEDGTSTRTYTLVLTREDSKCDRTEEVLAAIMAAVPDIESCGFLSNAHLAEITSLDFQGQEISTLQSDDFAGLSSLERLQLYGNRLSTLPAGLFAGLSALKYLGLGYNRLENMPEDVFFGLSALDFVDLSQNRLSHLPEELFSGLSQLEAIALNNNLFTSLPANAFAGQPGLLSLTLDANELTSLPVGVFSGLSRLQFLGLSSNALTSLRPDEFEGLSSLTSLYLYRNELANLPGEVFAGLSELQFLDLSQNALTSLPQGLFAGLRRLESVNLSNNAIDPLPLPVSLETVDEHRLKAVVPTGAPFSINLSLSVSNGGMIEGGADHITILAGAVESESVGVTKSGAQSNGVTVDIESLPALPAEHRGYVLEKATTLPLEISSADVVAPPARSGDPDVNGDGTLDADDAQIMYYAWRFPSLVGDGETGGTAALRVRFLGGYSGLTDPGDEDLRAMVARANAWRTEGLNEGGDINADGVIDDLDARAMYRAYRYESRSATARRAGPSDSGSSCSVRWRANPTRRMRISRPCCAGRTSFARLTASAPDRSIPGG